MNYFPLIIYHIQSSKKEKQIIELCKKMGIRTRKLKASDCNLEIGILAGIVRSGTGTHEKAPAGYQMPDMLIFSGLSDEWLDRFLADYRAAGIEPTGLKSVVTPHNVAWTVYELTAELIRERTAILLGGGKV